MSNQGRNVHLVLIETSGNQRYIFATNKLREQVGASELIFQAGTTWVLEAVRDVGGPDLTASTPNAVRAKLQDPKANVPIENGGVCEVVLAASGKALLLVRDRELGKEIVRRVTHSALEKAPGLDISGVVGDPFDFDKDSVHEQIAKVHDLHTAMRSSLPGPESRFQRIPIVAECRTSGEPACRLTRTSDRIPQSECNIPISHASLAKVRARDHWERRLSQILAESNVTLAQNLEDFEQQNWVAVIHADGNGLGQVFLNFDKAIASAGDTSTRNREYIDKLRAFSLQLDECSQKAFLETCQETPKWWPPKKAPRRLPVIPLIMGGDDLTVICAGAIGLRFAATYAKRFEECAKDTGQTGINISEIVNAIRGTGSHDKADGLTCSVGVAIVKPHFPFHAAYDLAEELLRSAKRLKPDPAIDFQIVYDSSSSTLEQARKPWRVDGGETELTARPYRLRSSDTELSWEELRKLVKRVSKFRRSRSEPSVPRSQLQSLREALFEGRKAAEAQLRLIRHRYKRIEGILWQSGLFFEAPANGSSAEKPRYRTHFLDLLEVEGLEREGTRKKR